MNFLSYLDDAMDIAIEEQKKVDTAKKERYSKELKLYGKLNDIVLNKIDFDDDADKKLYTQTCVLPGENNKLCFEARCKVTVPYEELVAPALKLGCSTATNAALLAKFIVLYDLLDTTKRNIAEIILNAAKTATSADHNEYLSFAFLINDNPEIAASCKSVGTFIKDAYIHIGYDKKVSGKTKKVTYIPKDVTFTFSILISDKPKRKPSVAAAPVKPESVRIVNVNDLPQAERDRIESIIKQIAGDLN